MRRDTLPRFILRVFLWIPVCFFAWYASAPYHGAVTGPVAHVIAGGFKANLVKAVERSGIDLVFVTRIEAQARPGETGMAMPFGELDDGWSGPGDGHVPRIRAIAARVCTRPHIAMRRPRRARE